MVEFRPSPVFEGFSIGDDGTIIGKRGLPLRPMIDSRGYARVSIYLGAKRWKRVGVHRLVCETFHGLRPEWADLVAHRDGDPANNEASNLRWATFLQNEEDKRRHGRGLAGERHHQAKLTSSQVLEIRRRLADGEYGNLLAREFGVSKAQISNIRLRRTWRHI